MFVRSDRLPEPDEIERPRRVPAVAGERRLPDERQRAREALLAPERGVEARRPVNVVRERGREPVVRRESQPVDELREDRVARAHAARRIDRAGRSRARVPVADALRVRVAVRDRPGLRVGGGEQREPPEESDARGACSNERPGGLSAPVRQAPRTPFGRDSRLRTRSVRDRGRRSRSRCR